LPVPLLLREPREKDLVRLEITPLNVRDFGISDRNCDAVVAAGLVLDSLLILDGLSSPLLVSLRKVEPE
jgi:hypothetical protein